MYGKVDSEDGIWMSVYYTRVVSYLSEKFRKLDRHKIASVFDNLEESIQEMNTIFQNDKLRTYGNQKIRIDRPVIGESSSVDDLLLRLERQVNHASMLAESCFAGLPANTDEAETLAGVISILRRLSERVVPKETPQGTSSDTTLNAL